MENNTNENIDSSIDETEVTTDTNGEVTLTVDDYNAVVAERDAEKAKNAKLYARLKKETISKPLEKVSSQTISPDVSQKLARLELQVAGITDPEAIDFILKNGGQEALKNPYVKKTVDNILDQKKAEQAQITDESNKSDFQRKTTPEQLKAMSSEEMEKLLPHA